MAAITTSSSGVPVMPSGANPLRQTTDQGVSLVVNGVRDVIWGAEIEGHTMFDPTRAVPIPTSPQAMVSRPFIEQTTAQFVYGAASTAVGVLLYQGYCKWKGKETLDWKQILGVCIAASLAIIFWNYGQAMGISLGELISNPTVAQWVGGLVFAPIFCGILEGSVQFLVKYAFRKKTEEDKACFWKEFGYNASIGALPGAVWQMVFCLVTTLFLAYGSIVPALAQDIISGAAISGMVFLANYTTGKWIYKKMEEEKARKFGEFKEGLGFQNLQQLQTEKAEKNEAAHRAFARSLNASYY